MKPDFLDHFAVIVTFVNLLSFTVVCLITWQNGIFDHILAIFMLVCLTLFIRFLYKVYKSK